MQVSVMHGSVIRGDLNNIKIGYFSMIQENCVIHAARYDLSATAVHQALPCTSRQCTSALQEVEDRFTDH